MNQNLPTTYSLAASCLSLNTAPPVHTATGILPLAKYRTSCA